MFRPDFGLDRPPRLSTARLQRHVSDVSRPRKAATERLFLAAVPDAETAERIADLARRLRVGHELSGKLIRPEHLHVTLHHVAHDPQMSFSSGVDAVMERLSGLAMPSFRVAFDRVGSFKNGAFVLRGDDRLIGLEVLQQRVSDALETRQGAARAFTPHVTLLRDAKRVEEHDITPIEWTVKEVVLVQSLLGRTTHRHVARLPLGQGVGIQTHNRRFAGASVMSGHVDDQQAGLRLDLSRSALAAVAHRAGEAPYPLHRKSVTAA